MSPERIRAMRHNILLFLIGLILGTSAQGAGQTQQFAPESIRVPGTAISITERGISPDSLPLVLTAATHVAPLLTQEKVASVFLVTTTNDTGEGSLRKALSDANNNPGLDLIGFDIPGPGVHTITPLSKLPNIMDPVTIDASTQPGFDGTPLIEINASLMGPYQVFDVFAGNTNIRGFAINRVLGGTAIILWTIGGDVIEGNFFGTDPSGTVAPGNAYNAVIVHSPNNRIGGRNAFSRNIFSGNGYPALALAGPGAYGNVVRGNYFGTDVSGTVKLGNTQEDILVIGGASYDTIGGPESGARNVISGSTFQPGISIIDSTVTGIQIIGNYIGTDASGMIAMGNAGNGIYLRDAVANAIGGRVFGSRNIISGNQSPGVFLDGKARKIEVLNNYIGVGELGFVAMPNTKGVVINGASDNLIEGNTISGNTIYGVEIRNVGASGNRVKGNTIGLSAAYAIPVGNGLHGVLINNTSSDTIGGTTAEEGNTIGFNGGAGISIAGGNKNFLRNNSIFGNKALGIDLFPPGVNTNDTLDADIGANNLQNYPVLDSLKRHPTSTDVYGHLISSPSGMYTIDFFADSLGDSTGFGEGERPLGSVVTQTGPSGTATFFATLPGVVSTQEQLTATATDDSGNTSEFSRGIGRSYVITAPQPSQLWVSGEMETIQWESADTGRVRIEFSADSGKTYRVITPDTSGRERMYPWKVAKAVSTRCRIRITSRNDPSRSGESELFKVKGTLLTRYRADSTYEAFAPGTHGWSFANAGVNMWPPAWFQRFNYATGIDPYTGVNYPAAWISPADTARSSDFPDWPLFVETFGWTQCYIGTITQILSYRPSAVARWRTIKGNWAGSCFGLSASSLLAFDNVAAFRTAFPSLPPFSTLNQAGITDTTRKIINHLFLYQFGQAFIAYHAGVNGTSPNTTLAELKKMFLTDDRDDRFLFFFGATGGHAVTPYRLETDSLIPEISYIYVYDNNLPGNTGARFSVATDNQRWLYSPLGWANGTGLYLSEPESHYLYPALIGTQLDKPVANVPSLSSAPGRMEVYGPPRAITQFRDGTGHRLAYADSVVADSIPGAFPIIPLTGSAHAPIGSSLPAGSYTLDLSGFVDSLVSTAFFADSAYYAFSRKDARPSQHDRITLSNGMTISSADSGEKTGSLEAIIMGANREQQFNIDHVTLNASDSLTCTIVDRQSIDIAGTGSPQRYNLALSDVSKFGTVRFAHAGIALSANSRQRIIPSWDSLSTGPVRILIDTGNRGVFRDTMMVNNQAVNASRSPDQVPDTYSLLQNYPNPFNPSTTIEYSIPERQPVRLEILNILGQHVVTLVDELQSSGLHRVTWEPGVRVASGMYFYRLRSGAFMQTKSMIFVR
jgi:parallel beta-helix repeat protein